MGQYLAENFLLISLLHVGKQSQRKEVDATVDLSKANNYKLIKLGWVRIVDK